MITKFIEHNMPLTKLVAKPMDIYTSKAWLEITCLSYLAAQIQNNKIQLVSLPMFMYVP